MAVHPENRKQLQGRFWAVESGVLLSGAGGCSGVAALRFALDGASRKQVHVNGHRA